MPLNDYEIAFNTLTLGGNTHFPMTNINGLSPVDLREDTQLRVGDHGTFTYAQWMSERRIDIDFEIDGATTSAFSANVDLARKAFAARSSESAFTYKLPGEVEKRILCVPTRLSFPVGFNYQLLLAQASLQLVASDPRIYENVLNTLTIVLSTGTGTGNAVTTGTFPTIWTAVFTGPGTTFKVTNNVTGEFVKVNASLTAGQTMTIDRLAKTVKRNDGTNLYGNLDATSSWFDIGTGTVQMRGDITSGFTGASKVDISYRSAWN